MSERIILCGGPLCTPCEQGKHAQCSWDGEPECACPECPDQLKAGNREALKREIDEGEFMRQLIDENEQFRRELRARGLTHVIARVEGQ